MSENVADRNLLFGILALQMDFVTRDALIAAMNAWVLDKQKPLGAMLVARGALDARDHDLLEPMIARHIQVHGNDPSQSLAAVGAGTSTRDAMGSIVDDDLRLSLDRLRSAATDADRTSTYLGTPTSPGGRFRILRFEAAGGLGEVYVARDEELHREVALKQIKDDYAHIQDRRSRFVIEAEITGGLEHPGIVPVYGLGHYDDGRPYYAMRFIRGETLMAAIRRFHQAKEPGRDPAARSLELRQLLRRFLDVCNAIQYAHDRGVLHRDLKPGNIMLGPYGETLVVDWGLAKVVGRADPTTPKETLRPAPGGDVAATVAGVAVGTPAYMSPEQARGDLDRLGPASDVYSLGATLYHLLTGQEPFQGADWAVLRARVIAGEFPPPRRVCAGVSAGMDAICRRAMAREPRGRYATPRALADDIEHWLADEPVTALPESWGQRAARWARRHRAWAQAGAAALALVTLVSLAAMLSVNHARGLADLKRKEASEQRDLAEGRRKEADAQRHRAELQLARSDLDRGLSLCEQGDAGRGLLWLARALGDAPADAVDLRHCIRMNLGAWSRECHIPSFYQEYGPEAVVKALSLDRKTVATVDLDSGKTVRHWDIATGKPIGPPMAHQGDVTAVAFSPDATSMATATLDTVRLWDAATGRQIGTPMTQRGGVFLVKYSPDGKTMATIGRAVRLWDAATGKPKEALRIFLTIVTDMAFSPDGKSVATASGNGVLHWDAATGKPIGSAMMHRDMVIALAFSPDGKSVATASFDGTARIWDAATGKPIGNPMPHQNKVVAVAFSPDGKSVATGSEDTTARLWDAATGKPIGSAMLHRGTVRAFAFSPDGKSVATSSADRTARLWDAATGKPIGTALAHRGRVTAMAFGPDGKSITTTSGNGVLHWDAATGKPIGSAMMHQGSVTSVAFSPDGKSVATASIDGTARLWDAATGKPIGSPMAYRSTFQAVAFSPDGKTVATGGSGGFLRWDAATGKPIGAALTESGFYSAVAFSPDAKSVATANYDGTARLWDAATGKPIGSPIRHQDLIQALAFSPDGKTVATASHDRTARLWDAATGEPIGPALTHRSTVRAVAFSPDGKTAATASDDRAVRLWHVATGRPIGSPMTHESLVHALAFSPDGKSVATASDDRAVRLWHVATGKPIGPALMHQDLIAALAFSPDGKTVATAANGLLRGTAQLWDVPSPAGDDAKRVGAWARFLTNMELDSTDTIHELDGQAWNQSREDLARWGGPSRQVELMRP